MPAGVNGDQTKLELSATGVKANGFGTRSTPRCVLEVPDEALVARLTARRQCPKCGHIYNVLSQPPAVDGICDADGTELIRRADDKESVILDRLQAYHELTQPIKQYYCPSMCRWVDGNQAPALVSKAIEESLSTKVEEGSLMALFS